MIGTIEIRCYAAQPQKPLPPVFSFRGSPSSLRILDVPRRIGTWEITAVKVAASYPDNSITVADAVRTGNVWVATFAGCETSGKTANGIQIIADGANENGEPVTGYVLGVGDLYILDRDSSIAADDEKWYVRYCETVPTNPATGDLVIDNGTVLFYNGASWINLSGAEGKVDKVAFHTFDECDLSDVATQREVRETVQTMLTKLKNLATCLVAMAALSSFALDDNTTWEDVVPTTTVKSVVQRFSPAPGNYETVSNKAMTALQPTALSIAADAATNYTDAVAGALADTKLPARREVTSPDWYVDTHTHFTGTATFEGPYNYFLNGLYFSGGESYRLSEYGLETPGGFAWWPEGYGRFVLTNDIPPAVSNVVTKTYVEGLGISSEEEDPIWSAEKSDYATKNYTDGAVAPVSNKVETTASIVNSWETYWGGSNVVFEVTNYYGNTSGELPRLRIKEYRDGAWTNVWDEVNKFQVCEEAILGEVAKSNAALRASLEGDFAPLAWGTVTDKGTPNHASNTVWMTSPETYFAGGTEYQRVAVGSGSICVLVDNGALARTTGEPGTFRFQDDGGTNFFGFAKTDSYTIGCRTDGITVENGLVTLRYDVIMGGDDVPIVYWTGDLRAANWVRLNNADGTAADGAPYTVTWFQDGGSYYAAINCSGNASGFFRAETSVAGDVVWETNMRARLGGGIECTNTVLGVMGVIRPSYNGSAVIWTWSAR